METYKAETYWVFKGNNQYSTKKFTYEQAKILAETLVNCEDCIDCIECRDCYNCTTCTYCTNCENCTECLSCNYCENCLRCYNSNIEKDLEDEWIETKGA